MSPCGKPPDGVESESQPPLESVHRFSGIERVVWFGSTSDKRTGTPLLMTSSSTSSQDLLHSPQTKSKKHWMKPSQKRSPPEDALVVILVLCIDAYKAVLSPLFSGSCRFEPSCSQFAREALVKYGARGALLATRRILRCRPFGGQGFDPVP